MTRHGLTHTTGGLQLASKRQLLRDDCSRSRPLWCPSGIRRLTTAIRLMICAGDQRQTAEFAAQRLCTSGWWRPTNRDERDATAWPQAASHAHSGVSLCQIVAATGRLRSPLQRTPTHSLERSRPSRAPTRQARELKALASPEGFGVIHSQALLPE